MNKTCPKSDGFPLHKLKLPHSNGGWLQADNLPQLQ